MLPLLLAALLAAEAGPAAGQDTVHLANGGRARGTVLEDDPKAGVTLQLADGTFRKYPRAEVARVEYAGEQAAAPAPPPPGEQAAPAEAGPPRDSMAPGSMTLAMGLSGAATSGAVSEAYGATSDYWGGFGLLDLEVGVRATPALVLLLQADLGFGGTAGTVKDACIFVGADCLASTFHIGVAARYAFTPAGRNTPWVSLGIGRETTGISVKGKNDTETIAFSGWEWLKLGAGWDWRFSRSFGLGAFLGLAFGTYNSVATTGPGYVAMPDLGGGRTHSTFQLGVRAVVFP